MDYLPEGTTQDLRHHGVLASVTELLYLAATFDRRTYGGSREHADFGAFLSSAVQTVHERLIEDGYEDGLRSLVRGWEGDAVLSLLTE